MENTTTTIPGAPQTTASSTNATNTTTIFPEQQAAMILWKFYTPGLLLLGGFGNLTTIMVMRRFKGHYFSSQRIMLMALAVSDFLVLYIGALQDWLFYGFNVESSPIMCKIQIWLEYAMGTVSAWLLICVTVERMVAVKWPYKVKIVCSLRRTWMIISVVVVSACTIHFPLVLDLGIASSSCCDHQSSSLRNSLSVAWGWVDMTISSIIPSVCLVVCDVILSRTLFKASASAAAVSSTVYAISNASGHSDSRRKRASKTTVMVVALSFMFLILSLPVCLNLLWVSYYMDQLAFEPGLSAKSDLGMAVTTLLWYTNSAINFLLYCFTGTKFRKEFFSMVCCRAQDHHT
ncbi:growth hormone secretagogue receptor type 1-like [Babylonia areolata]|uniref:growth hormone secretagogue receptor type 1-like n=1 Tax=Babylonia areolata TaxID=304850 RepID=UPI003FD62392